MLTLIRQHVHGSQQALVGAVTVSKTRLRHLSLIIADWAASGDEQEGHEGAEQVLISFLGSSLSWEEGGEAEAVENRNVNCREGKEDQGREGFLRQLGSLAERGRLRRLVLVVRRQLGDYAGVIAEALAAPDGRLDVFLLVNPIFLTLLCRHAGFPLSYCIRPAALIDRHVLGASAGAGCGSRGASARPA